MYLAHLEFISGEYEKNFYRCIPANSLQDAEKHLDQYLRKCYWDTDVEQSGTTYYFFHGEIAVKWTDIEELPSSPQKAYAHLLHILSI